MPKGPSRSWRKRKDPILDDEIRAVVAMSTSIHPPGEHDIERQTYGTVIHDGRPHFAGGLTTEVQAQEIVRALNRCAKFLGYSVSCKIEKKTGGYQVRFSVFCKKCATAYIQIKYPDPEKRPYNPRRPRNESDHK